MTQADGVTRATGSHLCECGCGEETSISRRTNTSRGVKKGDHVRFVRGHANRKTIAAKREMNPRWNQGGRALTPAGYVVVRGEDGHWEKEHRTVAMTMIGRPLFSNEVVHHRDGDKTNNSPDNLEILTGKEHNRRHKKGVRRAEWALLYPSCKKCGETSRAHAAHGLCTRCYQQKG